ncbi:MAG: hypothetical protein HY873_10290, partial [Chloroflexi bacterium]|nr:hypothetical protein [Chloroflexota bacterium]
GVNLAGKDLLARSWDIHAERGLDCVDCHFSLNNPVLEQMNASGEPDQRRTPSPNPVLEGL